MIGLLESHIISGNSIKKRFAQFDFIGDNVDVAKNSDSLSLIGISELNSQYTCLLVRSAKRGISVLNQNAKKSEKSNQFILYHCPHIKNREI